MITAQWKEYKEWCKENGLKECRFINLQNFINLKKEVIKNG